MPASIMPTMRYHDAARMLDWLCEAFGFTRHAVFPDGQGGIAHAELTLGDGMIMLGSAREDEFGALQATPRLLGGVTQSAYLVVPDVDALAARAVALGAESVIGPRDESFGGRRWSCRDPEGHLWTFGTYDPWAPKS